MGIACICMDVMYVICSMDVRTRHMGTSRPGAGEGLPVAAKGEDTYARYIKVIIYHS